MHIDWWTLALQTVNFLILMWLLARFFYRPINRILEERRVSAQKLLDEAKAARDNAEAAGVEIAATRSGFAAERVRILAQASTEADAARNALLERTAREVAAKEVSAEAVLQQKQSQLERKFAEHAKDLAIAIARRLLARLPAQVTTDAFLQGLCDMVRSLTPQSKSMLAAASNITITTAAPLDPAGQDRVHKQVEAALGSAPPLSFQLDKSIIAGMELSCSDMVLRNSWREDLRQLKDELGHDDVG